ARVDCARGPSLPSMLIGSPSTNPAAFRSEAIASSRAASSLNALRWMVSTPVASLRSGSETATPMVLVPRSRPTSAPRAGHCWGASISGRIAAGMASRITLLGPPAKGGGGVAPMQTPRRVSHSADRDRVDHALHAAAPARLSEHEQELIALVRGQ